MSIAAGSASAHIGQWRKAGTDTVESARTMADTVADARKRKVVSDADSGRTRSAQTGAELSSAQIMAQAAQSMIAGIAGSDRRLLDLIGPA